MPMGRVVDEKGARASRKTTPCLPAARPRTENAETVHTNTHTRQHTRTAATTDASSARLGFCFRAGVLVGVCEECAVLLLRCCVAAGKGGALRTPRAFFVGLSPPHPSLNCAAAIRSFLAPSQAANHGRQAMGEQRGPRVARQTARACASAACHVTPGVWLRGGGHWPPSCQPQPPPAILICCRRRRRRPPRAKRRPFGRGRAPRGAVSLSLFS